MFVLETVNELTLKATCTDGRGKLFTKAGAFIGGQSNGRGVTYQFEKVLLGPQGNPLAAIAGQIGRRITGENLPLAAVKAQGPSVTYYANQGQHVTVLSLNQGQSIMVESEDLLAFTESVKYSSKFTAQGVISQKGLFTSVLTGQGPGAQVAILTEGNPIIMNTNDGMVRVDPDAIVAWTGYDPSFKLDLSWKLLLGSRGASGESYQFEWDRPGAIVIVQPFERTAGLDISIDGSNTGAQPEMQNNPTMGQAAGNMGDVAGQLGNMLGGIFGGGNNNQY